MRKCGGGHPNKNTPPPARGGSNKESTEGDEGSYFVRVEGSSTAKGITFVTLLDELSSTGDPRLVDDGKFFETPPLAGPPPADSRKPRRNR